MASPEQIAANRRNSSLSTGPSTPSGKEISRRNGLKHGLTGDGIVLTREDEAEVERFRDGLETDYQPQTTMGLFLVGRLATIAVRLEKCTKRNSAASAIRVRNSPFAFEDTRRVEVEALFANLETDPVVSVRKLIRTPEGTLRLIVGLNALRDSLTRTDQGSWNQFDHNRLEQYAGRMPVPPGSPLFCLGRAIMGDLSRLEPHEGAGLDAAARKAWAVSQMLERIDMEVAVHQAHLESFDPHFTAIEQAEAADLAYFDTSMDETLARRYEAAAERMLHRTLDEFRQVEAEAAERKSSDATSYCNDTCEELASSLPKPEKAKPGPSPSPKRVETGSPESWSELDYDARRALARERELRAMR